MRKNQNYTGDFKVKVAQAYLFDHLGGYQSVAEHFGVTNRSQVQHWVKLYENNPQLLYQDNRGRPARTVCHYCSLSLSWYFKEWLL
jgi:transposase